MADGIFAVILFYSFVAGARRGFYKELVQTLALVVSIYATGFFYKEAGARLAEASGMPVMAANAAAGTVVWIVSFFVAAVVGRLILKKVRGKGVDDSLDSGAEAFADAIAGDTTKGPVTLLTDPIASKTGIFYWSDKILGCGLGLLKGIATGYMLFGISVYADRANNWNSYYVESIETSYAAQGYERAIEPYLATFPAYRIVVSLGDMKKIVDEVRSEPWRFGEFATHNELRGIASHPAIQDLMKDDEILQDWRKGNVAGLFANERVRRLLKDPTVRKAIGDVNWKAVLGDVKSAERSDSLKKLIPDGKGGTFTAPTGSS